MDFEAIIYTRNRAMQTDLLLRSMQLNIPDFDLKKIWMFHNLEPFLPNEMISYGKLKKEFPGINWISQIPSFKNRLKSIVNNIKSDHVLGLADDYIFTNKYNDVNKILSTSSSVKCINLFLTPESNWNFAQNKPMKRPGMMYAGNGHYFWNWTKIKDCKCDFAYSHNVVGHIYRTKYFQELLKWAYPMSWELSRKRGLNFIKWNGVNSLESALSRWRRTSTPWMSCYKNQILLHGAINTVQTEWAGNEVGKKQDQTSDFLTQKYLDGYQIKLEPFLGKNYYATGIKDITFEFEKRK